jgi:hypothetical protein
MKALRIASLLVALTSACDCGGGDERRPCSIGTDCRPGEVCLDGFCGPLPDGAVPDSGAGCAAGERACGTMCCAGGDVCGSDGECCPLAELCGTTCCDAGQVCEGAICRLDCSALVRCRDGAGAEVCCADGEVCASGSCFTPVTPCADFIDCGAGEYCEPALGYCLPQPGGEECASRPTGGEVVPTLLWHWDGTGVVAPTHVQVMMAPMVASLNDDDGDGDADQNDIPDVVFNTFAGGNYGNDGILRAVSGADGSSVFDATDPALRTIPGAQVAIGDVDGDGWNEIVTCGHHGSGIGPMIALNHDGTLLWQSTDPRVQCGMAAPALADLDADGTPEVLVRYTVLDGVTGALEWHQDCVGDGGWATSSHSPCDYTTAADLDGDGQLEVVGGNVAYTATGGVFFDRRTAFLDGYPAVGDLDRDGSPEVVVVHSAFTPAPYAGDHWLRALNADGTDRWGPFDLNAGRAPASDVAAGTVGGGGPPTIANFDEDAEPEIAAAGAYAYAVFEPDGTLKWAQASDDASSRKTGSSVFDFDGDGIAEVVYADHYWLRVYDGRDGNVQFCLCNTSATLWEYPVIADVDTDGHAEIVVASNNYGAEFTACPATPILGACETARIAAGENVGTRGVRVFASPTRDWVSTRRIWNQHTYHITNVTERGEIPRVERRNWTVPGLNDFRLNVQPGARNLPDPVPIDLAVDITPCPASMTLHFRVENQGWSAIPAGAQVAVYVEDAGGTFVLVTRVATTRALLPGESEAFSVDFDLAGRDPTLDVRFRVVVNDDGDPGVPDVLECRDANNAAETMASCLIIF